MKPRQDYTYSLDRKSRLINVNNAERGQDYYCPCCGAIMIPRQGSQRRWHFAHKGNVGKCSYETYLHKVAKRRIRECFNESPKFMIAFHYKALCLISECPLGARSPCIWNDMKEFDIKQYYNQCEEEVSIDRYRADLIISDKHGKYNDPILIEIYVTHKSTEEKLKSNYRIIEIHVESEEDIDKIVSTSSIIESDIYDWREKSNDKIRFYNFKTSPSKIPDEEHQPYKFRFWIDSKGYFKFDNVEDDVYMKKCLTANSDNIATSRFLIESKFPIDWDLAFYKLSQSGLGIQYCTMCNYYRLNDYYGKSMCILYKSKGTKRFPPLSCAQGCEYFKLIDYSNRFNINQECKVSIRRN